jgi:hypothetical protein
MWDKRGQLKAGSKPHGTAFIHHHFTAIASTEHRRKAIGHLDKAAIA